MLKKGIMLALVLVMALSMAACGKGDNDSPNNSALTTLDKAKQAGVIKVGFANEKPYAYKNEQGELTGEAVEIARLITERLGIERMEGELMDFGQLIAGLNSNKFDIITAGMFISPERCSQVNFADPEYSIGGALAVRQGNPKGLHSYDDIAADSSAKVAVMTGAIERDYMLAMGVDSDQIKVVQDQPAAITALRSGEVDAITMTGPSLREMLESLQDDQIERVEDFVQAVIDGKEMRGYGAAAFRLADQEFRDAYSEELQKLKASGELLQILEEFGFTHEELPGDAAAEQLCQ